MAIWTMFTLVVAALFLFLAPFSREVAAKQTASVIPLVLGGLQADKGRFPYLVSLLDDNFSQKCEGSLIAPDIVLTAAHCNLSSLQYAYLGSDDPSRLNSDHEVIPIIQQYIQPKFDFETRSFDQMLVQLKYASENQWVRVNFEETLPLEGEDTAFVVLGANDANGEYPGIWQVIEAKHISNEECDATIDGVTSYLSLGYDMICTSGVAQGRCNADFGGPYLLIGDSAETDLLVGVASWGTASSTPVFKIVGSRTSATEFIQHTTCAISAYAPNYMACDSKLSSPTKHLRRTLSTDHSIFSQANLGVNDTLQIAPEKLAKLFILFIFDSSAPFVSWDITNNEDMVVAEAPIGTYTTAHITEQIYLAEGATYTFTIKDAFADGISGTSTGYTIVLADAVPPIVLVEGDGNFGGSRSERFDIAPAREQIQAMSSPAPSQVPSTLPSNTPTSELPSLAPSRVPVPGGPSCKSRGVACDSHTDCCSARCLFGSCRASHGASNGRTSLRRNGSGGGAALASPNSHS